MVDKVFPGQPIKASTINQVIDAATSGRVTGAPQSVYQPKEVLVKNWTQTTWGACEPFRISGQEFMFEQTESALNKFLTFGAVLRGHAITSDTPSFRIGLTKESIKPGEIGRCSVPGLMGAKVYGVGTKYVKYDSTAQRLTATDVESEAQFALICGNNGVTAQDGMYFCFISPLASVGGGLKAYIDSTHDNVDVKKIVPGYFTSFSDTYGNGELRIDGQYGVRIDSGGQTRNVVKLIAGDNVSFRYGSTYSTLTISGQPIGFRSTKFSSSTIYEYLEQGDYIVFSQSAASPNKLSITLDLHNNTFVTDIGCDANGNVVVTRQDVFNTPS